MLSLSCRYDILFYNVIHIINTINKKLLVVQTGERRFEKWSER